MFRDSNNRLTNDSEIREKNQLNQAYSLDNTLKKIHQLDFRGNIIPHTWFKHIIFEKTSKPDLLGMMILSDIAYWYRPTEIRDEKTGKLLGYKKKFKADMLQRSINDLSGQFGVSRRQISDALGRLEKHGFILRKLRTINTAMGKLGNVLYLAPIVEKLAKIQSQVPLMRLNAQGVVTAEKRPKNERKIEHQGNPLCNQTHKVMQSITNPYAFERNTYTKNTTEITTKEAAAIGERKENNANACHGKQNNAAASFVVTDLPKKEPIGLADAIIDKTLTRKQLLAIQQVISDWGIPEPEVAGLTKAVENTILDLNQFKSVGSNFRHKVNTLKKLYCTGTWTPHIEEQICAKTAAEDEQKRAKQALLHRYHHLQQDNKVLTELISMSQVLSEKESLEQTKLRNDEKLVQLTQAMKQFKNDHKAKGAL